jgi:ribonuclease J
VRIRIHRGTSEIGGNCIELEAHGKSILLDLGMPLSDVTSAADALPAIPGLTDGTNSNLLAIIISHPHPDHYGLIAHAHSSIPVYIGREADQLLRAAAAFSSFGLQLAHVVHYGPRSCFEIGPFKIQPYLIDHSAFDAYSLLIEAEGKRVFYSGDLRGHGWKARTFHRLVANGPTSRRHAT